MKQKTLFTIIGVLVIILIIALAITKLTGKDKGQMGQDGTNTATNQQNTNPTSAAPTTPPEDTSTSPSGTGSGTSTGVPKLSYTDAVKKYGSNRIQFDTACQSHPNNVTYKAGTYVMFDNRAPVTRKIGFNGTTYTIRADDYTVIHMVAAKYPATILVDCDKSQNVATVLIQK